MKLIRFAAVASALAFSVVVPSLCQAQGVLGGPDSAWYIGGSVGQSKAKSTCSFIGGGCDSTDTAYRIFGGYQVNKNLALELGYQQLGDVNVNQTGLTANIGATAYDLSALGILPLTNRISAYGRLGVYYVDVDLTSNLPGFGSKTSSTDLTYGVGAQYDFANGLGIRAEWQKYNNVPIAGAFFPVGGGYEVVSVGAIWRFK